MTQSPRSSFIPKQTSGALPSRVRKKRKFRVFSFLSMVLLLASVVLAGTASLYKEHSESQLQAKKAALAEESNRFNEADMASVIEFDRRLRAAEFLLSNHLAPSKIFNALELRTKESVQFTDFVFSQNPSRDVSLTIRGGTEKFNSVALQSLQFGEDALFKDAVFTDIATRGANLKELEEGSEILDSGRENEHEVGFAVTATIPAELLVYTVSAQALNASALLMEDNNDARDVDSSGEEGAVEGIDAVGAEGSEEQANVN